MAGKGARRLYVLQVGSIQNDLSTNVAGVSAATKSNPNRPATWVEVPCLAYLVEHEDAGWILFDTGFRPEDPGLLPPFARELYPGTQGPRDSLASHLERLRISPADIGIIVVSHMHWDHGGGLSLFNGTPAGGRVLAGEADFAYGLRVTHCAWNERFAHGYFRDHFEQQGISFDLVPPTAGDYEIANGVRLVQLEGHTPQILGLLVDLPHDGAFLLPSDAVYMKRNLEPVITPPGLIYDSLGFLRSARKVIQLARERHARIIFPHDPGEMEHLKVAPDCYS